jgi:signal transduction histidine kinase
VLVDEMKVRMKGMERAHNLFMQAPVPIQIYKGDNLKVELANEPTLTAWGKGRDVIGKPLMEAVPELKEQGFIEMLQEVMRSGTSQYLYDIPVVLVVSNKEEVGYYNVVYQPYYEEDKTKAAGVLAFAFDVTEKVLAKKKAESSEKDLRNMVLSAPIGICLVDANTLISLIANNHFVEIAGTPLDEIVGKYYWDTFSLAKPYYEAALSKVITEGKTFRAEEVEIPLLRHGKEEFVHVSFVYEPLKNSEGTVTNVAIWVLDNSKQVKERRKVMESEANLRDTILQSPVAMSILKGPDFVLEIANDRMYELWGRTEAELLHKPIFEGLPEAMNQGYEDLLNGVFTTGEPFTAFGIPVTLPRTSGPELIFISVLYTPFREGDGSISGIIVVAMDVTAQKIATDLLEDKVEERTKKLQEANLDLKNLNAELEQFTFISHHDLQEPLRKIIMFADMVKRESHDKLSEVSQSRLDRVIQAAYRMSAALKDVLDFASLSLEEKFKPVNLENTLTAVYSDLEVLITEKGAKFSADSLPIVKGIPGQMHQLFYNLINNALKFSKAHNSSEINIKSSVLTTQELENHPDLDQTKFYYKLEVSDNGMGFNQEVADKIFDMFKRLHSKELYAGTGIGLALCKKVVLNHNGKIWAEGREGEGSSFKLLLPVD